MNEQVSGNALASGSATPVSGSALASGSENVTRSSTHEKPVASAIPLTDSSTAVNGNALASDSVTPVSGNALASGSKNVTTTEFVTLFITWTTYGTWLPGDSRGWRKWRAGMRPPQPLLEDWCRERMKEQPVYLNQEQRDAVGKVIREHAAHRGWHIHAVSVRSNHVHVAVTAGLIASGAALASGSVTPVSGAALASGSVSPVSGNALASGSVSPVSGNALASGSVTPVSGNALASGSVSPVSGNALASGSVSKPQSPTFAKPAASAKPLTKRNSSSSAFQRVRDEFKANATRVLRCLSQPISNEKVWTRGGDIQFIDTEADLEQVVLYITVAQDRMDRGDSK